MIRHVLFFAILLFGSTAWPAENINPKDFPPAVALTGSEKIPTYQSGWKIATPADMAVYVDSLDKYAVTVATIADLHELPAGKYSIVYVRGYATEGDGGEGEFIWEQGDFSTEVENDPYHGIYDSASPTTGCWIRQYSGYLHTTWFGSGETGIQRAVSWGKGKRIGIFIPAGEYEITEPIQVYPGQSIKGAGIYATRLYVENSTVIPCILSVGKPDGTTAGWPIDISDMCINAAVGGNNNVDGISTVDVSAVLPDGSTYWRGRCDGVTIQNVWLAALHSNIYLSGGDVQIRGVFSEMALTYGIYLINCNGVSVTGSTFFYNTINALVKEDTGDTTYSTYEAGRFGTKFSDCTFRMGTSRDLILLNTEGPNSFSNCDYGDTTYNRNFYSIVLSGSDNNHFSNGTIRGSRTAIRLDTASTNNTFSNIHITNTGHELSTPAIEITDNTSKNNIFSSCYIVNCGGHGIDSYADIVWIEGEIRDVGLDQTSGTWYAFNLRGTAGAKIIGLKLNRVSSSYMYGVYQYYDSPFVFTNNEVYNLLGVYTYSCNPRTANKMMIHDNYYSGVTAPVEYLRNRNNVTFYTSSIPTDTSITFSVGDRAMNTSVASGQPVSWVYLSGGWAAEYIMP